MKMDGSKCALVLALFLFAICHSQAQQNCTQSFLQTKVNNPVLYCACCTLNASCSYQSSRFQCVCDAGFTGDGLTSCDEIDECATANCTYGCVDHVASHECICDPGFTGDGVTCIDIDECALSPCAAGGACSNTNGSYTCNYCPAGFTGNGAGGCVDINECLTNPCHPNAYCNNMPGNYSCSCADGFTGDGVSSCNDVDECSSSTHLCDLMTSSCLNSLGGYRCDCLSGFELDINGTSCVDVDECARGTANCTWGCVNNFGGYECTCSVGFTGDGLTCTDIDECLSTPCHHNAMCTNRPGDYSCSCKNGFKDKIGNATCLDINECLDPRLNDCEDPRLGGMCINDNGSYSCRCAPGYIGDSIDNKVCKKDEKCPVSQLNLQVKPGETAVEFELAERILVLSKGYHQLKTRLSNGTICFTDIYISGLVELTCPSDYTIHLGVGELSVNTTWKEPALNGADSSNVKCVSCPPTTQEVSAGNNTISYSYWNAATNRTLQCSFTVEVVKSEATVSCSTISRLGTDPGRSTATFKLATLTANISIELPVGVHRIEINRGSGSCLQTIEVYDTKPVLRTVALQIRYPATCGTLSPIAYTVIKSFLRSHYTNLAAACSECQLPVRNAPNIDCKSNVLTVYWETGLTQSIQESKLTAGVEAKVENKLLSIQNDYLNLNGRFLDITLINELNPLVAPIRDSNGLEVRPIVISSCPTSTMIYDAASDSCFIVS